jgi:anthranilate synthase/aminodeoxychorismate synthase-like glutamine amidotransferase
MLLLIDNYDSFVYNLSRYFVELGCETRVIRNDASTVRAIADMTPQAIVISPGPCTPDSAGISMELIRELSHQIPTLGVCLGHQAIAAGLGGRVIRAPIPVHGRTSLIEHSAHELFDQLPSPLRVARYHSLIIEENSLPPELKITARTLDGIPMALQHDRWPLYGVQFHPESVMTQDGRRLLANFLRLAGIPARECSTVDWLPPDDRDEERPRQVVSW